MTKYIVTIEAEITCSGTITVEANNAAEAVLLARHAALGEGVKMSPMENGSDEPRIYQVRNRENNQTTTLGDAGYSTLPDKRCLTKHLKALLADEGIDDYEFDDYLQDDWLDE